MLNIIVQWKRRIVQAVFLLLLGEFAFYGIFRCPFAVPYVGCGNCPVIQCPGRKLWMPFWITWFISIIVLGKAFCGWACPVGSFSEFLGKISLMKNKIIKNRILPYIRYIVLLACTVLFFVFNNPRWAIPIRTGEFFPAVKLTFDHAGKLWIGKTIFFLGALIIGGFIIPAFWCRYLCPVGGIPDILRKVFIFKYIKTDACNDCDKCRHVCYVDTRPHEFNCTNCGDCVSHCPEKAIKLTRV